MGREIEDGDRKGCVCENSGWGERLWGCAEEKREQRTKKVKQRTENREQRIKNREQRTENREQRTENREQRTG